jgi:uncharacterized membrane protein
MTQPQILDTQARLRSLDILKGAIMVLMAVDHVRVYSGLPANSFEPALFFTRWITHFCAPGFAFLAGTSAYLHGRKINDTDRLSIFLVKRGLLLVFLELTLIRFFWTFNLDYGHFILAGVIWMLGWSMVLLGFIVRLKPVTVGILGVAIMAFQQWFKLIPGMLPEAARGGFGKFWEFIYPSGLQGLESITILYVIVPWVGVMAAGYGFGLIMLMAQARRDRYCRIIGWSAMTVFIMVAGFVAFTQPTTENSPPLILRMLNQQKYPASQLYLLMTLGPIIALIPFAERAKGWLSNILSVFGRVPFFYYLLHIPLIHLSALLVMFIRQGKIASDVYATAPFAFIPEENRWSLLLLYLVFIANVVVLYFLCRWYGYIKKNHPTGLMKYI